MYAWHFVGGLPVRVAATKSSELEAAPTAAVAQVGCSIWWAVIMEDHGRRDGMHTC